MPLDDTADRLDEIAAEIRTKWSRVGRDIVATQRLLNEARDLCRARRRSFDKWCRSGEFGIHKTQIHNLLNGRSSSHKGSNVHPVDVLLRKIVDDDSGNIYDKTRLLTPFDRLEQIKRDFDPDFDANPHPLPFVGYDSLAEEWGWRTYCNPMFRDSNKFVKKAILEHRKGKLVLIVLPLNTMGGVARLLDAGAVVYDLDIPAWRDIHDGSTNPLPKTQQMPCVWLVLIPKGYPNRAHGDPMDGWRGRHHCGVCPHRNG